MHDAPTAPPPATRPTVGPDATEWFALRAEDVGRLARLMDPQAHAALVRALTPCPPPPAAPPR